jgi:hypothetical protein
MSLTSAMRSLRMDIDNTREKRQDYIRSLKMDTKNMIDNFGTQRIRNSLDDQNKRMQELNQLRADVYNMRKSFRDSSKIMGDDTRKSLNIFAKNLKNDVGNMIDGFHKDMSGAKKEWVAVKKKTRTR